MLNFLHIFSHILWKNPRHHFIPLSWQFPDFIGFSYLMPIWSLDICDKIKGLHFGFSTEINVLSWVRTLLLKISPPPSLLVTEQGSQQLPRLASELVTGRLPWLPVGPKPARARPRLWQKTASTRHSNKITGTISMFSHNLNKINPS